jgi:hypothetical protein
MRRIPLLTKASIKLFKVPKSRPRALQSLLESMLMVPSISFPNGRETPEVKIVSFYI